MTAFSIIAFFIFALTLISIACFHRKSLVISLIGFGIISVLYILNHSFTPYIQKLAHHLPTLLNLFCMFTGFGLITRYLDESHLIDATLSLPNSTIGHFLLLAITFFLSIFIDNIAAVMIVGTAASFLFQGRISSLYIVAMILSANAGGAGSVIGDTTTTLLWLSGIPQRSLLSVFVGATVSFLTLAIPAAMAQSIYLKKHPTKHINRQPRPISLKHIILCIISLFVPVVTNIYLTQYHSEWVNKWPVFGISMWVCLLVAQNIIKLQKQMQWLPILKNTLFVCALVSTAIFIPIETLPTPSVWSTYLLGLVSSVFDNIPLTALAIQQGHYQWPLLAYAVGVGGSILWFGSSAGIALTGLFPKQRQFQYWKYSCLYVLLAYTIGFIALLFLTP